VIVTCGATIQWLRDRLRLIHDSLETEAMALAVPDNGGVYFVPAFSGLGAPHWKMDARAFISGLTFASERNHIARAALESVGYQIKDVCAAMEQDAGLSLRELKVDGGLTSNKFVLQFLADILNIRVTNIGLQEVSALGAAFMAGIGAGIYTDIDDLRVEGAGRLEFLPGAGCGQAMAGYDEWSRIIRQQM
jgi:glycerol kinase